MYLTSKQAPLLILAAVSLICSRVIFLFINDPEGPNLLVVVVLAVVIYLAVLGVIKVYMHFR